MAASRPAVEQTPSIAHVALGVATARGSAGTGGARARVASRWLVPLLALVLSAVSLRVLYGELGAARYRTVSRLVAALPTEQLIAAVALTAAAYVVLLGYDALALRYVGRRLPLHRTIFASFIAYAFSQNLGFSALTGASIRYRFWSAWGLSAGEIAQGIAFTTLSFWLGVLMVGGWTLLVDPVPSSILHWLPFADTAPIGVLLLLPLAAYLTWSFRAAHPIVVRGWLFARPAPALALSQLAVSSLDWTLAGAVLFVLLPSSPALTLPHLLAAFLVAQIIALISHVPGGLGVFESMMVLLLKPYLPAEATLASLVAYRAVYYLVPLALASLAFAAHEVLARRTHVLRVVRVAGRVVGAAAPFWLSGATFAGGAILLVSGATPSVHARMRFLDAILPLGVIEVSHFVGSVAGILLVILANGLRRRLDAAYHLTLVVLAVGIGASLLKGFDWEEGLALSIVLVTLLPARRHFYRRSALLAEPMTPGWVVAVAFAIGGALWLGFFSFKHVDYSADLWWRFEATADAPRFLRATVGVSIVALWFALARLLRPGRAVARVPAPEDLARAKEIARTAHSSEANLALLGDKSLLFSDSGRSFIQYGVQRRSWVALGDPVGDPLEFEELVWRFREMADEQGGRPVFYEVSRDYLPLYIDLGLTLLKLGEEARVPLPDFSLDGGKRKGQRRIVKDVEKSGASVEVIPPEQVPSIIDELRAVSDAWLAEKETREKGFSLGFFDEEYLSHFPIAIVRVNGSIVAFANIWMSGQRDELSVDLMRFTPDAPRSVMEYLFLELMLWGKAQGFAWLNMGMAPLSGFESRALAPVWHRIGALVFRHGEHFYNFRGLRQYKEKFDPVWEPRYLASTAGLALPGTLANVASLISGGLHGVIAK